MICSFQTVPQSGQCHDGQVLGGDRGAVVGDGVGGRGAGVGDLGEGRDLGDGRGGVAVDGRGVRVHGGVQHDGAPDYEHLDHRTWLSDVDGEDGVGDACGGCVWWMLH